MDRLTKLASKLYPKWWRDRYGEEFAALLEDARPGLGGTLDIAKGALAMQFGTSSAKRTLLAGVLAGLTIGFLGSFAMTPQFASQAVIEVSSPNGDIVESINRMSQTVMSRAALSTLIRNMNLYVEERNTMPVEDVLEKMRKNIRISGARAIVGGRDVPAFAITFIYPDAEVSHKVVNTFVSQFLDENLRSQTASTLRVLDPASLPLEPTSPSRRNIAVIGAVSGLVLSSLLAFILRRRKRQAA